MSQKKPLIKVNPIDAEKVSEKPSALEYPHHVGSAPIKINNETAQRSAAMTAMNLQTDQQLIQIKSQMELLAKQVKEIQERKQISQWIYSAKIRFKPEVNHIYHLYLNADNEHVLSLISPEEFYSSQRNLGEFVNSVKLMGDHTWQIIK